ncbi:hypothetical protein BHE90_010090 [Fusarium euwallaceae]|uniref:Uncharacterized protein n=1 Tax=Fusarium euwallaceae TaxID=1147111 RepID=A0A430LI96_9HYPO|nr:hypothetical protein BHE90_010090 [Fusarium euwallaceae]
MPPLSECNAPFGDSIKNTAALALGIRLEAIFIWLDDGDKKPEGISITISNGDGTEHFMAVEAINEIQGLIKSMSKLCDEGMKGRLDSSPSDSDIVECAKSALMEEGDFSFRNIEPDLSLVLDGTKTLATANADGNHQRRFQLMKKICEMGLEKWTSPNSTQVEQNGEDK